MATVGPLSTRLVSAVDDIDALRGDWRRLWSTFARPQLSQHPDFVLWDHGHDSASSVWVVVLEQDGALVGLAPLVIRRHEVAWKLRTARRMHRVMRFSVSSGEFCGDTLMAPDGPQATTALIDGMVRATSALDVVRFPYVREQAEPALGLKSGRIPGRWRWVSEAGVPVLTIDLTTGFDSYLRTTLSKKQRDNFRRESRILSEVDGRPLRLERFTEPEEVGTFLDLADDVFAGSWHAERGAKPIRKNRGTDERLTWWAQQGWLLCYVLLKGDEPIAFVQGQRCAGQFRALRTAFSSTWAPYSPGKMLWYHALQELFADEEMVELNFGYGEWEYKRILATGRYTVETIDVIKSSPRHAVVWSGPIVYRHLRVAAVRALRRLKIDDRAARWTRKRLGR